MVRVAMLWLVAGLALGQCLPGHDAAYRVSCWSDVDANGQVDLGDLGRLLAAFGSSDPVTDVTGDGVVDIADLRVVLEEFGSSCDWPPSPHAVLRFEASGDVWLDIPPDVAFVSGIQAWLYTEPGLGGTFEVDESTVQFIICGPDYIDGQIGFAFGARLGQPWIGSVHLGRVVGELGAQVYLDRFTAPPSRCSAHDANGRVFGLRFLVVGP